MVSPMKTGVGKRLLNSALAGVLAVGLMPLPAFASDLSAASANLETQAASTEGYVICAAYAAAEPAPEILGLNNPQYRNQGEADNIAKIFGGSINSAPDPYLVNMLAKETPGIITGGRQGSPMSALRHYDDETADGANAKKVWDLLPDIILGTGSDEIPENEANYYDDDARKVELANKLDDNSYNPVGVTYNRTNLNTMVNTMYRLATAADTVVSEQGKALRYGSALSIAKDYERYVTGTKGYVLKKLKTTDLKRKSVVCVYSYDESANAVKVLPFGQEQGTATQNRFLEAVQGVADNYYDASESDIETVEVSTNQGVQKYNLKTVSMDELKNNVDLIIMNTDASSGTDDKCVTALNSAGLIDKTYYGTNMSAGAVFGVAVNSVENAQNIGRILTCLYDEILDQSDFIAYYYDVFYHLNSGDVATTIGDNMDGVRNWNVKSSADTAANLEWNASDVADYKRSNVSDIITEGMDYLLSLEAEDLPDPIMTPTKYYEQDPILDVVDEAGVIEGSDEGVAVEIADEGWATDVVTATPGAASIGVKANAKTLSDESLSSEAKTAWQVAIDNGADAVYAYDIDAYVLNKSGEQLKSLTEDLALEVKVPVDAKYNDKRVTISQIHNGQTVALLAKPVIDGSVTIDVSQLSDFVLAVSKTEAPVYRMYDGNRGEHFYTTDPEERDNLVSVGWAYESIGWYAPTTGDEVYRLYNPNGGGMHFYTTDPEEKDNLVNLGWQYEPMKLYSAPDTLTSRVYIYRDYNPNSNNGEHNFTVNAEEHEFLNDITWQNEDSGLYAADECRM